MPPLCYTRGYTYHGHTYHGCIGTSHGHTYCGPTAHYGPTHHEQVELQPLLEALVSSVPLQRSLASLYLGTNKLPRAAAALLATFVGASSALGQLGISRTQIPPEGLEASLAAALANTALPPLVLDASDNELGERCARQLAGQLRAAAESNDGGGGGGGGGGRGSLRGLKLRGAGLCEAGVAALLAPLASHARLQTVDLSSNIRRSRLQP